MLVDEDAYIPRGQRLQVVGPQQHARHDDAGIGGAVEGDPPGSQLRGIDFSIVAASATSENPLVPEPLSSEQLRARRERARRRRRAARRRGMLLLSVVVAVIVGGVVLVSGGGSRSAASGGTRAARRGVLPAHP